MIKNTVLALALCAAVSLDGMHATRRVCKEIPKVIPQALHDMARILEQEISAREVAVQAQKWIREHSNNSLCKDEVEKKAADLRVNILPALIFASAQTRSVLADYRSIVFLSSSRYDAESKSEEYIEEFCLDAFGGNIGVYFYIYDRGYLAYKDFLRLAASNPDVIKITQLK